MHSIRRISPGSFALALRDVLTAGHSSAAPVYLIAHTPRMILICETRTQWVTARGRLFLILFHDYPDIVPIQCYAAKHEGTDSRQ